MFKIVDKIIKSFSSSNEETTSINNSTVSYDVYKYKKTFNNIVEQINIDSSDEILETLQEIDQLNDIYVKIYKMDEKSIMSNDEFIIYVEKLLKQRIKRKIDKYLIYNKDIEQLKSLIDELRCCKARYQQYSRVFDLYILQIENIIEI